MSATTLARGTSAPERKDSAFRIGDTKFVLQGSGTALIANAVTDPSTGNVSLQQAYATQG